jgi:hypothetical protein
VIPHGQRKAPEIIEEVLNRLDGDSKNAPFFLKEVSFLSQYIVEKMSHLLVKII